MKKKIFLVVGIFLTTNFLKAQPRLNNQLNDYRRWGVTIGSMIYEKAKIYPKYGELDFKNRNIIGGNIGFTYDFFPNRAWTLFSGFYFELEPFIRLDVKIKKEDIPATYDIELLNKSSFPAFSFNFPLYVKYRRQLQEDIFGSVSFGFVGKYNIGAYASLTILEPSFDVNSADSLFFLEAINSNALIQGGFLVEPQYTKISKNIIWSLSLKIYFNFQYSYKGTYKFFNLIRSPPSGGDYILSGNYFELSFSSNFLKKKEKSTIK